MGTRPPGPPGLGCTGTPNSGAWPRATHVAAGRSQWPLYWRLPQPHLCSRPWQGGLANRSVVEDPAVLRFAWPRGAPVPEPMQLGAACLLLASLHRSLRANDGLGAHLRFSGCSGHSSPAPIQWGSYEGSGHHRQGPGTACFPVRVFWALGPGVRWGSGSGLCLRSQALGDGVSTSPPGHTGHWSSFLSQPGAQARPPWGTRQSSGGAGAGALCLGVQTPAWAGQAPEAVRNVRYRAVCVWPRGHVTPPPGPSLRSFCTCAVSAMRTDRESWGSGHLGRARWRAGAASEWTGLVQTPAEVLGTTEPRRAMPQGRPAVRDCVKAGSVRFVELLV